MDEQIDQKRCISLSFISLKDNCCIEGIIDESILNRLLEIFEHKNNAGGVDFLLEGIQQNTQSLRDGVNAFLQIYGKHMPTLNGLKGYLNKLPIDNYFLIVKGKVTDTAALDKYFRILIKLHSERGLPQAISEESYDWGRTLQNYNMETFGHQRKVIGSKKKRENRVCRFCKTTYGQTNRFGSVVTFENKSHAFSEALGNKNVTILDECDACNDLFSRGIEPSLINSVSFFRSLYGLKGKGGTKKLTGENFELDPEKGFNNQYNGTIDPNEQVDKLNTELFLKDTFIPQDIYRCLVKFVLSVIKSDEFEHFARTIDWVNGEFDADDLPKISFVQHSAFYKEQPMLIYFQKKSESNLPYMIVNH